MCESLEAICGMRRRGKDRAREWALNSSRDTRSDSKMGLLTWLQACVILYPNMLSHLCDSWADCFSLKCEHIKDKIKGPLWFLLVSNILFSQDFSCGLWFSYDSSPSSYTFHLIQLITSISLTPRVIFPIYIQKIFGELNSISDYLKIHFMMIIV